MMVDMKSMNLTRMQKKRLVQLLGNRLNCFYFLGLDSLNNRYKKDNDQMILTCDMYMDPEQNEAKLQEMTKELYLEAKRAP